MASHVAGAILHALALLTLLLGSVHCSPTREQVNTSITPRKNPTISTSFNTGPASGYKTVLFFPNWDIYGRNYQPQDLPADKLSHVLYAFANVQSHTGEVYLSDTYSDLEKHNTNDSWSDTGNNVYGCVKQLYLLKKKHRQMKVLLSIGGATYSSNFATPMATASGRTKFATSAVRLLKDLGFDGLDVDWEYPEDATQAENMVKLLRVTRNALTNYSSTLPGKPHFLLTVSASAGPEKYQKLDIARMDPSLDFWNLMAYDYAGPWDTTAGHQANLYASKTDPASTPFNTNDAIKYYLSHGVAPSKMLLGMPLYGRSFVQTRGPGKSFSGVGPGSWQDGIWDYKVLPHAGATVYYDKQTAASWTYDNATQTMVSFDDPRAAAAKLAYIQNERLGGAMWWEANGDQPKNSTHSLICDIADGLGSLDTTQNVLNYPESQYDNLRNGMPGE